MEEHSVHFLTLFRQTLDKFKVEAPRRAHTSAKPNSHLKFAANYFCDICSGATWRISIKINEILKCWGEKLLVTISINSRDVNAWPWDSLALALSFWHWP